MDTSLFSIHKVSAFLASNFTEFFSKLTKSWSTRFAPSWRFINQPHEQEAQLVGTHGDVCSDRHLVTHDVPHQHHLAKLLSATKD